MKKLCLAFVLMCISVAATAQTKVGTIDAEFILSQMPEAADINKGLEEYNEELKSNLQATIKEHDSLVKNYQAQVADFTEEQKKQEENQIISLENDIQNFRQKASVMIQMKRNQLSQPLYQKIDKAMMEVIQEEGYTQIFHAGGNDLAFADERYDITEKVIKKLGLTIKEAPAQEGTN